MEVVEKEEANFDTEISEADVVGEWKLRGQILARTPVRLMKWLIHTNNVVVVFLDAQITRLSVLISFDIINSVSRFII